MDALNLGFGGSCHCEPELIEYLACRRDWTMAVLELGINMIGSEKRFGDEEFYRLALGAIDRFSADRSRSVFVITLFPSPHDFLGASRPAEPWRVILREIVDSLNRPNIHLIEGKDCLDWPGLTHDLVHPADSGHAQIGAKIGAAIIATRSESLSTLNDWAASGNGFQISQKPLQPPQEIQAHVRSPGKATIA